MQAHAPLPSREGFGERRAHRKGRLHIWISNSSHLRETYSSAPPHHESASNTKETLADHRKTQPHRLRVHHKHGIHSVSRIQTKKPVTDLLSSIQETIRKGSLPPDPSQAKPRPKTAKPRQWSANRVLAYNGGGHLLSLSPPRELSSRVICLLKKPGSACLAMLISGATTHQSKCAKRPRINREQDWSAEQSVSR